MKIDVMRQHWTDGKSAVVCMLLVAAATPIVLFGGRIGLVLFIPAVALEIVAMGFFWAALWKTRCRDVWAWLALLLGVVTLCAFVLVPAMLSADM